MIEIGEAPNEKGPTEADPSSISERPDKDAKPL